MHLNGWSKESDLLSSLETPKPKKSYKLKKMQTHDPDAITQTAYPTTLLISDEPSQTDT